MANSKKEVSPVVISGSGDYVAGDQAKGNTNSQINQGGQRDIAQTQTNSQTPNEASGAFEALESFMMALNNPTASDAASKLKREAEKPSPNKTVLSTLWDLLKSSVPGLDSAGAFVQEIQDFIARRS
jgi:hypothetical protein